MRDLLLSLVRCSKTRLAGSKLRGRKCLCKFHQIKRFQYSLKFKCKIIIIQAQHYPLRKKQAQSLEALLQPSAPLLTPRSPWSRKNFKISSRSSPSTFSILLPRDSTLTSPLINQLALPHSPSNNHHHHHLVSLNHHPLRRERSTWLEDCRVLGRSWLNRSVVVVVVEMKVSPPDRITIM